MDIGVDNAVKSFREKKMFEGASINAVYIVLEPEIFDYIEGDKIVFEEEPLQKLVNEGQLCHTCIGDFGNVWTIYERKNRLRD